MNVKVKRGAQVLIKILLAVILLSKIEETKSAKC